MNAQIRKIFVVVLIMFAMLGLAITNTQFISAPSLNADPRNVRTTRHAAEVDRGPIIVEKRRSLPLNSKRTPIATHASTTRVPSTYRPRATFQQSATGQPASRKLRRTFSTASLRLCSGSACATS